MAQRKVEGKSYTANGGFVGVWPYGEGSAPVARLKKAYMLAIDITDQMHAARTALKAKGTLTERGLRDELRNIAKAAYVPPLIKNGRQEVAAARGEAKTRRANAMAVTKADQADLAGAILRAQIRDRLSAMTVKDRLELLFNSGDETTKQAAIEAPAFLSGLSDQQKQQLVEARMSAEHGEELAYIEAIEQAADAADRAVMTALNEIGAALDMTPPEFEKFATAAADGLPKWRFESGSDPYLRNTNRLVRVQDEATGAYRKPTAEEFNRLNSAGEFRDGGEAYY